MCKASMYCLVLMALKLGQIRHELQNWQVFQYETTQYTLESLIGAKVFFLCGLWVG